MSGTRTPSPSLLHGQASKPIWRFRLPPIHSYPTGVRRTPSIERLPETTDPTNDLVDIDQSVPTACARTPGALSDRLPAGGACTPRRARRDNGASACARTTAEQDPEAGTRRDLGARLAPRRNGRHRGDDGGTRQRRTPWSHPADPFSWKGKTGMASSAYHADSRVPVL